MFLKKFGTIALSAILIGSLAGCSKKQGAAAEVNGVEIPIEDYYKSYAARVNQLTSTYGEDVLAKEDPNTKKSTKELLREQTVKDLTQTEMIKQDAKKSNIEITEDEVNKQLEDIKTQLGGEETFNEYIEKSGMPLEYVKENISNQMLLSKWSQEKAKKLEPTEEDVKKYYEENKDKYYLAKASHILVNDLKEANVIRKEIQKGGDFAKIAKEKSKDPGSAENGGSLGEFKSGQMVPQFDEAIAKMKVGDLSEPIQSQFGYHVIKLEDKKALEYDEIKDQVKKELQQKKFSDYIAKLEKDSKIKTYVDTSKDEEVPAEYKDFGKIKQDEAKGGENTEQKNSNEKAESKNGKAETKEK